MLEYENQRNLATSREVLASLVGREGVDTAAVVEALVEINSGTSLEDFSPEKISSARKTVEELAKKPATHLIGARLTNYLENIQDKVNHRYWEEKHTRQRVEGLGLFLLGGGVITPVGLAFLGLAGFDVYNTFQANQMNFELIRQAYEPIGSNLRIDCIALVTGALASIMGSTLLVSGIEQAKNSHSQKTFIDSRTELKN